MTTFCINIKHCNFMSEKTCCTLLASTSCKNLNHRANPTIQMQESGWFSSYFKRKLAPVLRKHTCYITSYLDYDEPLLSEERVFHNAEPVFKQHYQKQLAVPWKKLDTIQLKWYVSSQTFYLKILSTTKLC